MLRETSIVIAPQVQPSAPASAEAPPAISLVIPVYNECESVRPLYEGIVASMESTGETFEIVYVDDGSTDGSFEALKALHAADPRVHVIRFRRNFGKSPALLAGFSHSRGDIIFTMDADLQDDPAEIPQFLEQIRVGYDLVSGWKFPRLDPISKTFPSKIFNTIVSSTTGVHLHDMNCGFKAYRRELIDELKLYGELHRFIPVMAKWRGFSITEVKVKHHPRQFGKSKFGAKRFLRGFLDLVTVLFLTSYIRTPLRLFGPVGIVSFLLGFGIDAWVVANRFVANDPIRNHPIVFLGILLMIVGVQFILSGLQSEMIRHFNFNQRDEFSVKQVLD
ncbi:MAG: glycosyltransferase family 2 protein [Ktedonobacterales bacterium]|nr:glycosyltransferase family 2 protein [Ktedonobacterales bacterium]